MLQSSDHMPDDASNGGAPVVVRQRLCQPSPNYNPLFFPPDISKAEKHRQATLVGRAEQPTDNYDPCDCCGKNVLQQPLPICCNLEDLDHLGMFVPLFYHFKKFSIYLLMVVFVISGVYMILSNKNDNAEAGITGINQFSYIATDNLNDPNDTSMVIQTALNLFAIFIFLIIYQLFRDSQNKIVHRIDQANITASDYTLIVSGLENMFYSEQEIKDFFAENALPGDQKAEIESVLLTYDIHELDDLHRKRVNILHQKRKLQEKLPKQTQMLGFYPDENNSNVDDLREKIELLDRELEQIESELMTLEQRCMNTGRSNNGSQMLMGNNQNNNLLDLTGVVFVIFKHHKAAKLAKKHWKMMWYNEILQRACCCNCCCKSMEFNGRIINVQRAPEPTDIYWENLDFCGWPKVKKRIATSIYSVITILAASVVLMAISYLKTGTVSEAASMGSSVLIVIINTILTIVIKRYSTEERHHSHTIFEMSVAEKLAWAQFLNTAIIPFFVYYYFASDQTSNGLNQALETLSQNMLYVFFSNAFITPLTYLLDPFYLMQILEMKQLWSNNSSGDKSQQEAHTTFQGAAFEVSSRYATLLKTIWMTGLYASFIPLCIPLSIAGLFFSYWVDKYLLLRRYSVPLQMGKALSKRMTEYMQLFTLFLALGNLTVGYWLNENKQQTIYGLCIAGVVLSLLHFILPMRAIHKKFRPHAVTPLELEYSKAKLHFQSDYFGSNPMTQAINEELRLAAYINTMADGDLRNQYQQQLDYMKNNGGAYGLRQYASNTRSLNAGGGYGYGNMNFNPMMNLNGFYQPPQIPGINGGIIPMNDLNSSPVMNPMSNSIGPGPMNSSLVVNNPGMMPVNNVNTINNPGMMQPGMNNMNNNMGMNPVNMNMGMNTMNNNMGYIPTNTGMNPNMNYDMNSGVNNNMYMNNITPMNQGMNNNMMPMNQGMMMNNNMGMSPMYGNGNDMNNQFIMNNSNMGMNQGMMPMNQPNNQPVVGISPAQNNNYSVNNDQQSQPVPVDQGMNQPNQNANQVPVFYQDQGNNNVNMGNGQGGSQSQDSGQQS